MTAVDWSKEREPWRTIGPRAAKEFVAICRGEVSIFENPMAVTDDFVELLLDWRKRGRTLKEVAQAVGCHQSIISLIIHREMKTCRYIPEIRQWLNSTTSAS